MLPEENAVEESDENSHSTTTVKFMFAGILFVINGVLCNLILGKESAVGDFSAMIGAFILGFRIFRTAIRDLEKGY